MPFPSQVDIRLPLVFRIYSAAFLLLWVATITWVTIIHNQGPSALMGVAFLVFGCAIGYRILRLGVRSDADGVLNVHNHLGSRRLTRSDIEEFRLGNSGGLRWGQRGIQALLRDGTTYSLDVCRTSSGMWTNRLHRHLDELNAWLRAS